MTNKINKTIEEFDQIINDCLNIYSLFLNRKL